MNLWRYSGMYLCATGIIHNAVGVMMGKDILLDILHAGVFNSVNMEYDRNFIFWFLISGFFMIMMGQQWQQWLQERQKSLPASAAYWLLFFAITGVIIMPVSGFWLLFPQIWIILFPRINHSTGSRRSPL